MTTRTLTGGIRDLERSGEWLVWPWPEKSDVSAIVAHCIYCWPQSSGSNARRVAFYRCLLAVIDDRMTANLGPYVDARWLAEFRAALANCVPTHEARLAVEAPRTTGQHRPARLVGSPGLRRAPVAMNRATPPCGPEFL